MCEAVHAVGSEQCTHTQVKKTWSDLKVEVKQRVSAAEHILCVTFMPHTWKTTR